MFILLQLFILLLLLVAYPFGWILTGIEYLAMGGQEVYPYEDYRDALAYDYAQLNQQIAYSFKIIVTLDGRIFTGDSEL